MNVEVFVQEPLPYPADALEPHMCKETLDYHYGKHHATYFAKLNAALVKDETKLAQLSLSQIVLTASGGIFNNAAQAWNHTFFWNSLRPNKESTDNKSQGGRRPEN